MNDDDLIARLARLDSTRPDRILDPAKVLTQGRRARRRRLAGGASAATLSVAAIVGLILALPHGGAGESVMTPAEIPTASPSASPAAIDPNAGAHNSAILQRALAPDFEIGAGGKGGLLDGHAAAVGLPTGYTATAMIDAAYAGPTMTLQSACDADPRFKCEERRISNGETVAALFEYGRPGHVSLTTPQQVLRVMYQRSDGVLVIMQMNADERSGGLSAARQLAVSNWLDSMIEKLGTVATDPAVEAAGNWGPTQQEMDVIGADATILQRALGPAFVTALNSSEAMVKPRPGTAVGLPDGFGVIAVLSATEGDESKLQAYCRPNGCSDLTLPDGKVVEVVNSAPEADPSRAGHSARIGYLRPDGVLVTAFMLATYHGAVAPAADSAAVEEWLHTYEVRLGAAVTDPGVQVAPQAN